MSSPLLEVQLRDRMERDAYTARAWLPEQLAMELDVDVADVRQILDQLVACNRVGVEERNGAPSRFYFRNPSAGRPMGEVR